METTSIKLYSLNYNDTKTYLATLLFVVGNMALPQLFHLIPQGGITWLPIYFFTLIGAYKYGWKVGLLTALLSPVLNSLLFGMPQPVILPAILLKSTLLAIAAGYAAHRYKRISIPILLLGRVILSGGRHFRRMDPCQRFFQCRTGFPYRSAGNGSANIRRLSVYKPFDL